AIPSSPEGSKSAFAAGRFAVGSDGGVYPRCMTPTSRSLAMALPSVRESPLPAAWSEVLDSVLQALERTAKEAARLNGALELPGEAPSALPQAREPPSFDALQAIVARAERAVADVDKLVSAEEQVVRQGLEKLAALGRRLAEGAAG